MATASPLSRAYRFCKVGMLALSVNVLSPAAMAQDFAKAETPMKIVAFGDSLTAGYLLSASEAFPAQLAAALARKGHAVDVVNAGVSGDTTANGLERFDWAIGPDTAAVILELGANDALRGLPPAEARANLDAMLARLKHRNIPVLLAGMKAPKNWGEDYARTFDAIYPDLAAKYGAILYPFFLDGITLDTTLNLDDGLHPNGQGVKRIVDQILPKVEDLIARARTPLTQTR